MVREEASVPKKTVRDLEAKGRRVFVRVDFNVPLEGRKVTDDTRIRAALPTIELLVRRGAKVILASHLGRPKGEPSDKDKFSLAPAAARLGELMKKKVAMAPDCVGPEVNRMVGAMKPGDVLVLENTRFHKEEEKNDPAFAKELASVADAYVDDAFGSAHRAHASTEGVTHHLRPKVAGLLMQKELDSCDRVLVDPERPFVAILGGAKVSDKIGVVNNLLEKVDALLVGGAMAYTFLKARGVPVGASKTEEDKLDLAKDLLAKAEAKGVKLMLPTDHVVADRFAEDAESKVVGRDEIPDGWMALDIGPGTVKAFAGEIAGAKTVVWNGPMGVFEMKPFAGGTFAVANAIAGAGCVSVVGGGDSVAAVNQSGLTERFTHVSTGGGASLELLEGLTLPGVAALDEA
jgi:3-phosphoglycerate kinase